MANISEHLDADYVSIIAKHIARPHRELDDVAYDAANFAIAGLPNLSRAVWAQVATIADGMGTAEREAAISGCSSQTALGEDILKLGKAAGINKVRRANNIPVYQVIDFLESDALVSERCQVPRCVALYVLRMAKRRMPPSTAYTKFPQADVSTVPRDYRGYLYHALRRAPLKPRAAACNYDHIDQLLAPHGLTRAFWVKTPYAAKVLLMQKFLRDAGLPEFVAKWLPYMNEVTAENVMQHAAQYKDIADELHSSVEQTFGRQMSPNWGKAGERMMKHVLKLAGDPVSSIAGYAHFFTADMVRQLKRQAHAAYAIISRVPPDDKASVFLFLNVNPEGSEPYVQVKSDKTVLVW